MISLAPPRNPHSQSARDRRWTVIIAHQGQARYIELYGTRATDPEGAQAEANRILERSFTWSPRGTGFLADLGDADA
jgi:hypothetical protein